MNVYQRCQRHRRKKGKNFEIKLFKHFVKSLVQCILHLKIEVLVIFHFQVFWLFLTGINDTGEKCYCLPVSTTPAINCIDDRGLLLLQSYLRPPKSATATDIVIGTAMKTRKGTSQTLIRGPGGHQSYFKPKGINQFWQPQGPLIKMCGLFLDATFHGGFNDTIGRRGRLQQPKILPIYPLQLSPILGSSPPPWRPCSCDRQ